MTRTTELLKKVEKLRKEGGCLSCRYNFGKWILCEDCLREFLLYKSELKGRLDALKEEVEWLIETFGEEYDFDDFDILLQKRLASIQEEIKLIESAGVGKMKEEIKLIEGVI